MLLLLTQFAYGTAFSSFFILPKYLIQQLGADASLVGDAHGAFAIAGLLSVPVVGWLLDRFGRRSAWLCGLALSALSFGAFGFATSPAAVLMLRALHGVGFSLVFNAGSTLAVDLAPEGRRAEAIGYFGTAMLCTNALGPFVAEQIAAILDWQLAFLGCAVYASVAFCFAYRLKVPPFVRAAPGKIRMLSQSLLAVYVASIALGIGVGASKTFIPALMVEAGIEQVATYFVAFTAGAMVQRLAFGWVPDRIGLLRTSALALLLYGLAMLMVLRVPATAMPWLAIVIGLAHGAGYPAISALAISVGPQAARGRVTSWVTGGFNLGWALSTAGIARFEPHLGYRGLVGLGGATLLLCAVIVPLLLRGRRRLAALPRSEAA